jgi:hypothetical protein
LISYYGGEYFNIVPLDEQMTKELGFALSAWIIISIIDKLIPKKKAVKDNDYMREESKNDY